LNLAKSDPGPIPCQELDLVHPYFCWNNRIIEKKLVPLLILLNYASSVEEFNDDFKYHKYFIQKLAIIRQNIVALI
jgi:hypothetical protein